MTEYKVGDKVRVKFEGEVSYVNDDHNYIEVTTPDDIIGVNPYDPAQVIEKIVEIPTKTGALLYPVNPARYSPIVRDREGEWAILGRLHRRIEVPEDVVRLRLERGNHYVAFEGVEE